MTNARKWNPPMRHTFDPEESLVEPEGRAAPQDTIGTVKRDPAVFLLYSPDTNPPVQLGMPEPDSATSAQ
jgi:hypothetical protein